MQRLIVDYDVFIDPLSDFGFKKIYGSNDNRTCLIDLLNAILNLPVSIVEVSLINTEQLGELKADRKAVFDIHCRDADGNYFIIEIQRLKEEFFKDRSVYYSTFPIRSQGRKGNWNFQLKRVYTVCILDFCFDNAHSDQVIHKVKLLDLQTMEVFYDQLAFVYVELPKFSKEENELITREDKWLYVLRNLISLKEIPLSLSDDPVFKQFFMDATQAHLTELELQAYYAARKAEWDAYAIKETAMKEGKAQGMAEGKAEGIAQGIAEANTNFITFLLQNTDKTIEEIAAIVGVDIEFVKKIKQTF